MSTSTHQDISFLLLGDGPVMEPLEQALAAAGHDVELGAVEHAAAIFTAVAPELVVLCGSATEHGGTAVLAALSEAARDATLKVVVLGAASGSARATALAPNLPAPELARRLAELARAPAMVARPAAPSAKAAAAPKPIAAPRPIAAPKPIAAPMPVPAAEAPAAHAWHEVDDDELGVVVEADGSPAPASPEPSIPVVELTLAPTERASSSELSVPAPAARPPMRRVHKAAAVAALALSALGLLLLPALGSHAKGARKLSAVEITGTIAAKPAKTIVPAAAPVPAQPPPPAQPPEATPVAPSEVASSVAAAPEQAATPEADRAPTGVRMPSDPGRPQSPGASLAQAKNAVRKAGSYVRDGRLGMAESEFLKALSMFPRYPIAIAGLVRIHLQRRDAGEALRWAKMLVATQPNRGANQRMLGDAYALSGKPADATRAWQQALRYGDRSARERLGS